MSNYDRLPYRPDEVKEKLQDELERLLRCWFQFDRLKGRWLHAPNPRGHGRSKKGFVVWLTGQSAGAWIDYEGGQVDKGDVYKLIQYCERLDRWIDAYWWAVRFLNLPMTEAEQAPRPASEEKKAREDRDAARAQAQRDEEARDEARAAELFKRWQKLPPITGTLAETYLREARGIPLQRIGSPKFRLGALRFDKRLEHIDERTGEVTYWPAMVAVMVKGPKVKGLHRTWLRPDGRGKAEVAQPRKMLGRVGGAAIRLTTGDTGLSPKLAAERGVFGPLAIGEGIETSLSVAAAMPHWRVWAAGSLALMGQIDWPECADRVVLLQDNDWASPAAQRGFERAVAHWRRQAKGRPVHVAASEVGKDFNDWARGAA